MWELHFLRQSCHRLGPSPPLPEEAPSAGYWTRVFPDSWCWWKVENRVTTYLRDNQDSYGQTPCCVRTFKQRPAWFCWLTYLLGLSLLYSVESGIGRANPPSVAKRIDQSRHSGCFLQKHLHGWQFGYSHWFVIIIPLPFQLLMTGLCNLSVPLRGHGQLDSLFDPASITDCPAKVSGLDAQSPS